MPIALPMSNCFRAVLNDQALSERKTIADLCHQGLRSILRSERWRSVRFQLRQITQQRATFGTEELSAILHSICLDLRPWRTGPISLGPLVVDAEWRSALKWSRIQPLLPSVTGGRIADVGCSNGYFLFQLSNLGPELVVGMDPVDRCFLQYVTSSFFNPRRNISFIPVGLDALKFFSKFYDVVVCMGVIYHQRDPFSAVKQLYNALKPGGVLILESLSIPSEEQIMLIPTERYAKMRNAWNIPSRTAMEALVHRAGFREITSYPFGPITTHEQRRTEYAHFESLADFLDPLDSSRTVEGFPAPHSTVVVAVA
jgi:tRNA (mo5U34)-methyltransferase